jgi:hypothetical protein
LVFKVSEVAKGSGEGHVILTCNGCGDWPVFPAVAALAVLFVCAGSCRSQDPPEQTSHTGAGVARWPTLFEAIALEPFVPASPPGVHSSRDRDIGSMVSAHRESVEKPLLGPLAWTDAQWHARCRGVRTSYNPDADLREDALTLRPSDPRWLDFVFWTLSNKVNEHQVEAYGGTGWHGPEGGVLFHWAPGSRWERESLHSFGFFIGHIVGEHRWTDTMFPDFFEKYGGVYGVNVKDRLAEIAPGSMAPWVEFLEYQAGVGSPPRRTGKTGQ